MAKADDRIYVLVTGGREFGRQSTKGLSPENVAHVEAQNARDRQSVEEVLGFLRMFYGSSLRLIHGGAQGLDSLAAEVCQLLDIPAREYKAEWNRHGKAAGAIRNEHMISLLEKWRNEHGCSIQVIAWPGGKGTDHCTRTAEQRGLDVDYIPTVKEQRSESA